MADKNAKPKVTPKKTASKQRSQVTAKPAATNKSKSTTATKTAAKTETIKAEPKKAEKSRVSREKSPRKEKLAAVLSSRKFKLVATFVVSLILSISLGAGLAFGMRDINPNGNNSGLLNTRTVLTDKPTPKSEQLLSPVNSDSIPQNAYKYEYSNATMVDYYAEVTGEYKRVKPVEETKDERDAFVPATGNVFANNAQRYPKYGSTLKHTIGTGEAQVAARAAIIQEAGYLCAWGTAGANRGGAQTADKYTRIDKDGYLYQYKDGEWIHSLEKTASGYGTEWRQLYKHSAANGMYMEGYTRNGVKYEVSDDAPGVVKEITMRSRAYGYGITGLYAPAGEVIKVEISGADMNSTNGITIHIGQALYNGQANNIWVSKNQMQRFPYLLTTLNLNKSTCEYNATTDTWTGYVGSFIGGPIYIRNKNTNAKIKISGGLEYLHYILGYTTEEEFNRLKTQSKVPYFDLEVWHRGVLHSGPRYYAETFSYEKLYKAAMLWDKVASVTAVSSNQGIVFLYDPFVAAGAAVAFPGRSSVNCPLGWMSQSLNYNGIVTSGSWGNFHEYHHNFQGYGVGAGGEVTNNALTLVSYALFTKISSNRGIGNYGAQGLSGWNRYTSASWALNETLKATSSQKSLPLYATLLHNFGAAAFTNTRKGGQSYAGYMGAWQNYTHNNMYYYFNDILHGTGITNNAPADYPMFVPVSCVYQTGRSYMYNGEKKYFKTMQPYVIAKDTFDIDLSRYTTTSGGQYESGSIVIPNGFTYKVKSVTKPANGSIEFINKNKLKYTPAKDAKTGSTSGEILVTLEITKDDGAFKVDDVTLILEFQISQEVNRTTLTRTTYTYTEQNMYSDAETAFNNKFAGGTSVVKNHVNFTQNANTDIWYRPDTEKYHTSYPNDPDSYFAHNNTIDVVDGKLYFASDGKYRVYLRGRLNCALYYSLNGKKYYLGATIKDTIASSTSHLFRPNDSKTYFDIEFDEGNVYINGSTTPIYKIEPAQGELIENWLYIKEVMLVENFGNSCSYIGVGMKQWDDPQFTQEINYYYDEARTEQVTSAEYDEMSDEEKLALYTKTYYLNSAGQEVSEEEVMSAQRTPPTITNNSQPYINAYRTDYNFPDNGDFESDYFYLRDYNINYTGRTETYSTWDESAKLVETNFVAENAAYKIDNLFVEGTTTFIHPRANTANGMYFTLDMGKMITANKVTFRGRTPNAANTAQQGLPKKFTVEISTDGVKYTSAGEYTNGTGAAHSATVNLNNVYKFRYVKITMASSHSNTGRIILSGIEFSYTLSLTGNGANRISPHNDSIIFTGNWKAEQGTAYFGLYYHGKNGSKVNFQFTGTRVAVVTSTQKDSHFNVYIDGKKVDSIDVLRTTGNSSITYLSPELSKGKHKVEIRCTGDTYIDSFALY